MGYHNVTKTVTFEDGESMGAQRAFMEKLRDELKKNKLWTWVNQPRSTGLGTWEIKYGFDSGD